MNFNGVKNHLKAYGVLLGALSVLTACEQNPKDAADSILLDVGGYISYQNPVENVKTGTMVGGKPSSMSFVAPAEECFPEARVRRHVNKEYLNRKYQNAFQGNVGFLSWGTSGITGSGSLTKDHLVVIEINGIMVEYLNAIDVTRYYREGMDQICKDYLDEYGFVVQSALTSKLSIAILDKTGVALKLDETNINEYLTISGDMKWEIVNNYRVDISTPHYLGYHLGQLRKGDGEMVRFRARSAVDDKFVFEKDGAFKTLDILSESFKVRRDPGMRHLFIPSL